MKLMFDLQWHFITGVRHWRSANSSSRATITGGAIGQSRVNVTVTSRRGEGLDSVIFFYTRMPTN